jgi:DNA-binding LacI/PurR family transcriptional regulator
MDIRQVAKRAGVSTATVSRTINNMHQVKPGTARRVWKAIEELKYFPNGQARSLVSGRSHIVGLIVSDITNPFFPELVQGFEDAATQKGYEVLLSNTQYDSTRMATGVRRMLERKVDAVAIMTSEMDSSLTQQLAHNDIPMVFLDVGKVDKHVSNIKVDYALGISQAVGHLLELGHRRIAFISGPGELQSARIRRLAFLKAMNERGVAGDQCLIETGNHRIDGGFNATSQILHGAQLPTAVLCSNDLTAIGGLRAIRRHGGRVPDDISVVGFDDIALAEFTEPPLTTVRLPRREMACKAFEALLAPLGDTSRMGVEYSIAPELIVRESTAKARDQQLAESELNFDKSHVIQV